MSISSKSRPSAPFRALNADGVTGKATTTRTGPAERRGPCGEGTNVADFMPPR
jgi:hypothetical protein